jgi:spore germination protein YaaH
VSPTPVPSSGGTTRRPAPGVKQEHIVWIEEARSAAARLNIADKYGLAGVGAWRLGQEDAAVWPLLESWRNGS